MPQALAAYLVDAEVFATLAEATTALEIAFVATPVYLAPAFHRADILEGCQ